MSKSKIEWTESVWNPVTGCSKVSPGCKNCYAEKMHKRLMSMGQKKYSKPFDKIVLHRDSLREPFHWRKPRMIFVNSMSDLFHKDVPFEFIDKIFDVMVTTPRHTYQILTKRPERMLEYCIYQDNKMQELGFDGFMIPNFIWMGVSVEDQKTADERIPILLETPAAVRWISAEPLLEEISIEKYLIGGGVTKYFNLNWVVVGGESGKNKRPFNCDWARKLHFECNYALVPFFMKQVDKVQPIPEDLMIREYPK